MPEERGLDPKRKHRRGCGRRNDSRPACHFVAREHQWFGTISRIGPPRYPEGLRSRERFRIRMGYSRVVHHPVNTGISLIAVDENPFRRREIGACRPGRMARIVTDQFYQAAAIGRDALHEEGSNHQGMQQNSQCRKSGEASETQIPKFSSKHKWQQRFQAETTGRPM